MTESTPAPRRNPSPLVLGLLCGAFLGWLGTYALTTGDGPREAKTAARKAASPASKRAGGPLPDGHPPTGKLPERHPPTAGAGGQPAGHGGDGDRAEASFAKVHFMRKFVAALREPPANKWPASDYEPLLKDSVKMSCADCHDPRKVKMEAMIKNDPGHHKVASFRANPNFMIPLMRNWVARLNKDHAGKLREPVTCGDCHGIDPEKSWSVLPPLMVRFVKALSEKPQNTNPAAGWRPLLKDPDNTSMMCSVCHGEVGRKMEREAPELEKARRDERYTGDKAFMVALMERWVDRLNESAVDLLNRKVSCLDCHDTDPRG